MSEKHIIHSWKHCFEVSLIFNSSICWTCYPLRMLWIRLSASEIYKWLAIASLKKRKLIRLCSTLSFSTSPVAVIHLGSFSFRLNLLVFLFNRVICGAICYRLTWPSYQTWRARCMKQFLSKYFKFITWFKVHIKLYCYDLRETLRTHSSKTE
jgi:hypothetical protein